MNHEELFERATELVLTLRAIANRGTIEDGTPFDGYSDTVVDLMGALHRCMTKEREE